MGLFQRGGIEPPPPEYRGREPAPGANVVEHPLRAEVQAACEAAGIKPEDLYRHGDKVRACYDPVTRAVHIIARGQIPDDEWQRERDHEVAHSWGLIHHPDGQGWQQARGAPDNALTHDWARAFGITEPPANALRTPQPSAQNALRP